MTAIDGAAMLVVFAAPVLLVGDPRPADVVRECTLYRERALLEIIVMMRRQPGRVARTGLEGQAC